MHANSRSVAAMALATVLLGVTQAEARPLCQVYVPEGTFQVQWRCEGARRPARHVAVAPAALAARRTMTLAEVSATLAAMDKAAHPGHPLTSGTVVEKHYDETLDLHQLAHDLSAQRP